MEMLLFLEWLCIVTGTKLPVSHIFKNIHFSLSLFLDIILSVSGSCDYICVYKFAKLMFLLLSFTSNTKTRQDLSAILAN